MDFFIALLMLLYLMNANDTFQKIWDPYNYDDIALNIDWRMNETYALNDGSHIIEIPPNGYIQVTIYANEYSALRIGYRLHHYSSDGNVVENSMCRIYYKINNDTKMIVNQWDSSEIEEVSMKLQNTTLPESLHPYDNISIGFDNNVSQNGDVCRVSDLCLYGILVPGPSFIPTSIPTMKPTILPTMEPTILPTVEPTILPTVEPTTIPTSELTKTPTFVTIIPIQTATTKTSNAGTSPPTYIPTIQPTMEPTLTAPKDMNIALNSRQKTINIYVLIIISSIIVIGCCLLFIFILMGCGKIKESLEEIIKLSSRPSSQELTITSPSIYDGVYSGSVTKGKLVDNGKAKSNQAINEDIVHIRGITPTPNGPHIHQITPMDIQTPKDLIESQAAINANHKKIQSGIHSSHVNIHIDLNQAQNNTITAEGNESNSPSSGNVSIFEENEGKNEGNVWPTIVNDITKY